MSGRAHFAQTKDLSQERFYQSSVLHHGFEIAVSHLMVAEICSSSLLLAISTNVSAESLLC